METDPPDTQQQQQQQTTSTQTTTDDIQQVLQQFSCLGTTDKEVLIIQLQKLIGPQLNQSAANFFLDMNNWNLQSAVGAYFDLTTDENILKMQLLSDEHNNGCDDDKIIPPYTKFIKLLKIHNNGLNAWPIGSHLKFKSGHHMAIQNEIYIHPIVQPGETRQISIEFLSPQITGHYNSSFQMCTTDGQLFGDEIWIIINVQFDPTDLSEEFQGLSTGNGNSNNRNVGRDGIESRHEEDDEMK